MASLCAGMLSAVISLKYIGKNWNIVLREADAGINRLSYFLAVSGIWLSLLFTSPSSFLSSLLYSFFFLLSFIPLSFTLLKESKKINSIFFHEQTLTFAYVSSLSGFDWVFVGYIML